MGALDLSQFGYKIPQNTVAIFPLFSDCDFRFCMYDIKQYLDNMLLAYCQSTAKQAAVFCTSAGNESLPCALYPSFVKSFDFLFNSFKLG